MSGSRFFAFSPGFLYICLRPIYKKEALLQFDKDFDVLYGLVYYPKNDIYFFNWGIGTKATNYYLEYMEKDSGDTITTTDTYSFTFSTNITGHVGAKEVKYSTGIGTTSTGTQQISTTHQEQSELLSRVIINYSEDVVLNRTINSLDTLFTLRHYDNNAISVCIVPAEMY